MHEYAFKAPQVIPPALRVLSRAAGTNLDVVNSPRGSMGLQECCKNLLENISSHVLCLL